MSSIRSLLRAASLMTPTAASQKTATKTDFFPRREIGILDAAQRSLRINRIGSCCRPDPDDDYRVLKSCRHCGTCKTDHRPILISCTKEKAGILGSGLANYKLVAGVRFELTTFGL